jgi:hypothetical protein
MEKCELFRADAQACCLLQKEALQIRAYQRLYVVRPSVEGDGLPAAKDPVDALYTPVNNACQSFRL